MRRFAPALFVVAVILAVTACSSQPTQPPAQTATEQAPAPEPAAAGPDQQPATVAPAAPRSAESADAARPAAPAAATAAAPGGTATPTDTPAAPAPAPAEPPAPPVPEYREVTIPAGTHLSVVLDTTVASDKSQVEDRVVGYLNQPVEVDGLTAIPRNARLTGTVTEATRSGKVKGRARVAFRFNQIELAAGERHGIRTATVAGEAQSTKKDDAKKIGVGAVGGAIIGGIAGGGKGAAIGTAVGGGIGTGAVMMTRGDEVELAAGTPLKVQLTAPLTVSVRLR